MSQPIIDLTNRSLIRNETSTPEDESPVIGSGHLSLPQIIIKKKMHPEELKNITASKWKPSPIHVTNISS